MSTRDPRIAVCPRCGSWKVVKFGTLKGKQKYRCRACYFTTLFPNLVNAQIEVCEIDESGGVK
jgi:hypothetical protein